ncbi:hypothetical protein [Sporosarcina sp. SG10008]|uniref:hypothetical protein n=1 Tax=Sporosarcina sp. SG10008 TaxID=3373103 RepID=UPI0037DCD164
MWGKLEQTFFWIIAYIPVVSIGSYRFFFENQISELTIYKYEISGDTIDIISVITILAVSITIYMNTPKLALRKLERKLATGEKGGDYQIKHFEKLNLNDYTFFLLTLILPLITVDFSSPVSTIVCFFVVVFIITLLVKIDYIIACPLFFVSSYKIWRVKMVEPSMKDIEIDAFLITKINDFFEQDFRAVKLIKNVYLLTEKKN